jgi:heterotetrameric sarcosine oxidase gamma subunit
VVEFRSPITRPVDGQSGVVVSDESAASKVLVKAAPDTAAARSLGVPFGSSAIQVDALVLGSRPGEWTLLFEEVTSVTARIATDGFVSIVDWTHSRGMLRLTGDDGARALEKVCNIDFSDHMTPDGAVLSIGVAGIGTDLVRNDVTEADGSVTRSYLLLFDRSFGQSLYDSLIDAASEFSADS